MRYMGSKRKLAKEIMPIILSKRKPGSTFYDVFCGGGNVCENVDGEVVAVDNHKYLIAALETIRDNPSILPKHATEEFYYHVKQNKEEYHPGLVGYVGHALSFGGRWFSSWNRDKKGRRDFAGESFRSALKQSPKLSNVKFVCADYRDLAPKPGSLIYCDPPYRNVCGYSKNGFNHSVFWGWCIARKHEGSTVFVSEYSAPTWATCVWEKDVAVTVQSKGSSKAREKLFVV